jgi:hypothetical protein
MLSMVSGSSSISVKYIKIICLIFLVIEAISATVAISTLVKVVSSF